MGAGQV